MERGDTLTQTTHAVKVLPCKRCNKPPVVIFAEGMFKVRCAYCGKTVFSFGGLDGINQWNKEVR